MANEDQLESSEQEVLDDETSESSTSLDGELESTMASEIERLTNELQEAKDQVLRATAEMQNVRRRAEQDVEKAHKFGLEKFVADMVVVADNLERSTQAFADESAEISALKEGVELTLKSMVDNLARHKVEAIDPEGTPFDPQFHQAMTAVEQPDVEPNTVINVYQKGYTLHGRLVRPAMVVVSKAPNS